jgi:hypothetical protein
LRSFGDHTSPEVMMTEITVQVDFQPPVNTELLVSR